jgi:hypothetical protein
MTYPQVQQPAWQPPPVRPPLGERQRKGAALAGAVGFVLLSLGFAMVGIPLAVLAFGAFFSIILRFIGRVDDGRDADLQRFENFFEQLNPGAWVIPLVIVAVVGLAIMTAALFISARILRSHGVNKPWPVTWAGAGVAIVGSWLVSGVISLLTQLLSFGVGFGRDSDWAGAVIIGVVSFVVNLAASAVIGWLAWWWMAHLMRPATPTDA